MKFVRIKELPHKVVPWIKCRVKVSTGLSRCLGQPEKGWSLQRDSPASFPPSSWSSVCPSPPAAAARGWFPHTPPANDSHNHLFTYFLCFSATLGASRTWRRMNAEAMSCKPHQLIGMVINSSTKQQLGPDWSEMTVRSRGAQGTFQGLAVPFLMEPDQVCTAGSWELVSCLAKALLGRILSEPRKQLCLKECDSSGLAKLIKNQGSLFNMETQQKFLFSLASLGKFLVPRIPWDTKNGLKPFPAQVWYKTGISLAVLAVDGWSFAIFFSPDRKIWGCINHISTQETRYRFFGICP